MAEVQQVGKSGQAKSPPQMQQGAIPAQPPVAQSPAEKTMFWPRFHDESVLQLRRHSNGTFYLSLMAKTTAVHERALGQGFILHPPTGLLLRNSPQNVRELLNRLIAEDGQAKNLGIMEEITQTEFKNRGLFKSSHVQSGARVDSAKPGPSVNTSPAGVSGQAEPGQIERGDIKAEPSGLKDLIKLDGYLLQVDEKGIRWVTTRNGGRMSERNGQVRERAILREPNGSPRWFYQDVARAVLFDEAILRAGDVAKVIELIAEPYAGRPALEGEEKINRFNQVRGHLLREVSNELMVAGRNNFLRAAGFLESKPGITAQEEAHGMIPLLAKLSMARVIEPLVDLASKAGMINLTNVAASDAEIDVAQFLAEHPNAGALYMSGHQAQVTMEAIRSRFGLIRAIESYCLIEPGVAGNHNEAVMLVFGAQRPVTLDELPEAARRIQNVTTTNDLWNWGSDVLRSRDKIERYHAGEAEHVERQVPYSSLSMIGDARTMVPKALEGATRKALSDLETFFVEDGGLDAFVAKTFEMEAGDLNQYFSVEQMDAMGLFWRATSMGRGFLNQDGTGIGKGRFGAGSTGLWRTKRENGKVIYFTESGNINAPDVLRDLVRSGMMKKFNKVGVLAIGCDPREENLGIGTMPKEDRDQLLASGSMGDYDFLIVTYSQSNTENSAVARFLKSVVDENVMVVVDESQNAVNTGSNTGKNLIEIINKAGAKLFLSATPMRPGSEIDLYASLFPDHIAKIIDTIGLSGSEIALQEALTNALARDGVIIRRDHDLSDLTLARDIPQKIEPGAEDAPQFDRHSWYIEAMGKLQPVLILALQVSTLLKTDLNAANHRQLARMNRRNLDPAQIDAILKKLNGNSTIAGPMEMIVGGFITALKSTSVGGVPSQVVERVLAELNDGRKSMITMNATNGAMLDSLFRNTSAEDNNNLDLTIRDFIRRITDRFFIVRRSGEKIDIRATNEIARRLNDQLEQAIEDLPPLCVSPIDRITADLQAAGLSVGEITGRNVGFVDGQIVKMGGRNKRSAIDKFNSGEHDVVIMNGAGATGGSMHADPSFGDTRPRTKIELEVDPNIVRYIQSIGRGHRYNQLHGLKIVALLTGMLPELRRAAVGNAKLARIGAITEGNRDHSMRNENVVDMINVVGDEAALRWIGLNVEMAAQMELSDVTTSTPGLMNRILSRLVIFPHDTAEKAYADIVNEFQALTEELDSRNENPLKPRRLDGHIRIDEEVIYSGNPDAISTFDAPVYLATGVQIVDKHPISFAKLEHMINANVHSPDYSAFARQIEMHDDMVNAPMLALEGGLALQGGAGVRPGVGARNYQTERRQYLRRMVDILGELKVGMIIEMTDRNSIIRESRVEGGQTQWRQDTKAGVITRLIQPSTKSSITSGSAYQVEIVFPGEFSPEKIRLNSFVEDRQFGVGGMVLDDPETYARVFDDVDMAQSRLRVQVLHGNIFQAWRIAKENKLGQVTLYRTASGQMSSGIVVNPGAKIDLERLPVMVSVRKFIELANDREARAFANHGFSVAPGDSEKYGFEINIDTKKIGEFNIYMPGVNQSSWSFWDGHKDRQAVYSLLTGQKFPENPVSRHRAKACPVVYAHEDYSSLSQAEALRLKKFVELMEPVCVGLRVPGHKALRAWMVAHPAQNIDIPGIGHFEPADLEPEDVEEGIELADVRHDEDDADLTF